MKDIFGFYQVGGDPDFTPPPTSAQLCRTPLKKALISIWAKCWILEMKTYRNVGRPSLGVRAPLAMVLGALERGDTQLSPGSNQVENFWSMLEKIDFEIWPKISKIENFKNRKIGKILIFEKFQLKSLFFRFFDFSKFSTEKNLEQISKSIFSNIDQKFSTRLDPSESWTSPLSNAPTTIANGALTPKLGRSTLRHVFISKIQHFARIEMRAFFKHVARNF